jgi:hypothetical protein
MAYKKITSLTFDVMQDMTNYLFQHQNKLNFHQVQVKVADYLVSNGEKKFLQIYNETQVTNHYIKALDTFKI